MPLSVPSTFNPAETLRAALEERGIELRDEVGRGESFAGREGQSQHERLGDALDGERCAVVPRAEDLAVQCGDGEAEGVRVDPGQRRDVVSYHTSGRDLGGNAIHQLLELHAAIPSRDYGATTGKECSWVF